MNSGKKQSSQKTRQPYERVTEVGQVPIALQEIKEMASGAGTWASHQNEISDYVRRMGVIRSLADSIITVTCANPGCLSQMAEGLPHRQLEMVASGKLKPIEQAFTCHGCNAEIVINQDDPKCRMFEWAEGKTGKKIPYCYNCDDILIQDGELPNAKKKREVQS